MTTDKKLVASDGQVLLEEFLYTDEPPAFTPKDLDPFLIFCTQMGASDITIQVSEPVICEVHGRMRRVTRRRLNKQEVAQLIAYLCGNEGALSDLNGGKDVDRAYEIKPDRNSRMRFRVNCTAIKSFGHTGYQVTLRTIPGMPPAIATMKVESEIIENIAPKQGLVLVTGATGSGKSTLLASIIRMLLEDPEGHRKILTYEAPIEFVYDEVLRPTSSIAQSAIPDNIKSFSDGIRNALRRKPSIILVGEMRDKETIAEGVTASMTGHLVYSTLHSNGVADAVRRMVNVFPPDEKHARAVDIISSVKMIVSQMLIPSQDGRRVALREYLVFNDDIIDELLEAGVDNLTYAARNSLKKYGRSFLQDATQKHQAGLISDNWLKQIARLSRGTDADAKASTKPSQGTNGENLLGIDLQS